MNKKYIKLAVAFATLNFLLLTLDSQAQYTKILDFAGITNGNAPSGDLFYDGTYLFGTTSTGGANNKGVIFKIMPDGTGYTDLLDFAGTTNGKTPLGSLISDGTYLYGLTSEGGSQNMGVLFKIKKDGTGFANLIDFTFTANGSNPMGSLFWDGTFLYGTTFSGGVNSLGTIFKIKTDGTGFSKLLDFADDQNGKYPQGSLMSDGTYLFGTTTAGGTNNIGVVFKIKKDGTGYGKLIDFSGVSNGSTPLGSLLFDGLYLYGTTSSGGANSSGTVFKIKPDGTGYANLHDFTGFPSGSTPWGSVILEGTYLYGMTRNNGAYNGVIFKVKPDGTDYTDMYDFTDPNNGAFPQGSLTYVGTSFYGMTFNGGINSDGVIFKYGLTTGISDISNENTQMSVFPNPTKGKFSIKIDREHSKNAGLEIFNALGKKIYSLSNFNHQTAIDIDLSNESKGIYLVKFNNGNNSCVSYLIVE